MADPGRPLSIAFLIRALPRAGAERQLCALAAALHRRGHKVCVITFRAPGGLAEELIRDGIPCLSLERRGWADTVGMIVRLFRLLRTERPDVLHSYMPGANVVAAVVSRFLFPMRLVWGVRSSTVHEEQLLPRVVFRVAQALAHRPDLIICNSNAGRNAHLAVGYPPERTVTVPNGIDTHRFTPDLLARREIRAGWGVRDDEKLVGIVGRIHPEKGHDIFLDAAAMVAARMKDVIFLVVGTGDEGYVRHLQARASEVLKDRVRWTGETEDTSRVYNGLDLLVSASHREGFSNVIAEAMAINLPCVVSDVGDAHALVGDTGVVVPPGDVGALASAMCTSLAGPGISDDRRRRRIVDLYSVDALAERTSSVLAGLLPDRAGVAT